MDTLSIPLTQGFHTIIDAADAALVAPYRWHAHRREKLVYAGTNVRGKDGRLRSVKMHQLLLGSPQVDHVDGDGLNNRRSNLRPCTAAQNACNRRRREGSKSSFYGVTYDPSNPDKPWRARAMMNGVKWGGRRFRTEIEAAIFRDDIARQAQGEFARLNFPEGAPEMPRSDPIGHPETCTVCGSGFTARRRNRAKYCSATCREKRSRAC